MKLKYTDKTGLLISFLFFVSLMKIQGQDSSGKAGGPRVGGREGGGRGLGGGTEGGEGSCPLCALRRHEDSGAGGAGAVVGTVAGEAPLGQPWALPPSDGRIPCHGVKLSACPVL